MAETLTSLADLKAEASVQPDAIVYGSTIQSRMRMGLCNKFFIQLLCSLLFVLLNPR